MIYFEGNGKTKAVTVDQARDQLILALKAKRDEVLANPELDSYEDSAQRDRLLADRVVHGVLSVLDGETDHYPVMNLIPVVTDEDIEEATSAGADHFDPCSGHIGNGLAAYWDLVNN